MPPRSVFIASLGHSGSTLLSLCLAGHDRITSFGEAVRTVELMQQATTSRGVLPFEDRICTCGCDADDCPIWGEVHAAYQSDEWSTTTEGYRHLLNEVETQYGSSQVIVDSSKGVANLEKVSKSVKGRVAPLYLIRDIRGWIDSQQRKFTGTGSDKWDGIKQHLLHTTPGAALRWYKLNKNMKKSIKKYDCFQVGYEELCLQSEEIFSAIADWLNIEFEEDMTVPATSDNHLIRGNRMKDDPDKLEGIYYDNRWFYNSRLQAFGLLFVPVFRWNIENVYKNLNGRRAGNSIHATNNGDS